MLVRAAASGVGVAFALLLKARLPHITLHGACRKLEKAERLRAVGFDAVIADSNGVLQTDERYDKILELVGLATLRDSLAHINEGGIVCQTGQLGNQWYLNDFDPIVELKHNSYLATFHSALVSGERMAALFRDIDAHNVPVPIERRYTLEQVPDAHRFLQSAGSFGKVVVVNE